MILLLFWHGGVGTGGPSVPTLPDHSLVSDSNPFITVVVGVSNLIRVRVDSHLDK